MWLKLYENLKNFGGEMKELIQIYSSLKVLRNLHFVSGLFIHRFIYLFIVSSSVEFRFSYI